MGSKILLAVTVFCAAAHAKVVDLFQRQGGFSSTCGYLTGDPNKPRRANQGYYCALNSTLGLWGFCTNTITNAGDCQFYGRCTDAFSCTAGCGPVNVPGISSMSCYGVNTVCSTDILINNGNSYAYVACGGQDGATYYALPLSVSASTTSSASSSVVTSSSTTPKMTGSSNGRTVTTPTSGITPSPSSISPTSTSTSSVNSGGTSTTNLGAIIGGVLGGLALICLTILGVVLLWRKSSEARQSQNFHDSAAATSVALQNYDAKMAVARPFDPDASETYKAHNVNALHELHGTRSHLELAELNGSTYHTRPTTRSNGIEGMHEM